VTAVALASFTTILDEKIPERAARAGRHLMTALRTLAARRPVIRQVRGRGLLIGIELTRPAAPLVDACREAGLLVLTAGENVLRLAPPLIVDERDCDRALAVIDGALDRVGA
jgi:acetylornithine aminotransferase